MPPFSSLHSHDDRDDHQQSTRDERPHALRVLGLFAC
jgi:hypothetical protein